LGSDGEIKPYLYRFPSEFSKFEKLFIKLGSTKKLTMSQCADVLSAIYRTVDNRQLDVNESKAAIKAMAALFALINQDQSFSITLPCQLYFLSTAKELVLSTNLVFEDNPRLSDRLENFSEPYLIHPKHIGISDEWSAERILNKLHPVHRPKFLSRVVQEKLDASCEEDVSEFVNSLRSRLESPVFQAGFKCIMKHSLIGGDLTAEQMLQTVSAGLDSLKGVAFECRRQVKTHLMYNDDRIANSDKILDYFFDCSRDAGSWTVYVTSKLRDDSCFFAELAKVLKKVAGGFVQGDFMGDLAMILRCPMTDVRRNLERQNYRSLGVQFNLSQSAIGSFVPQNTLGLLILDLFFFQTGLLAALEMDDPLDRNDDGPATCILVEIVGRVNSENAPSLADRYNVKTSVHGDEKTVDAIDLYAFLSSFTDSVAGDTSEDSAAELADEATLPELTVVLMLPGTGGERAPAPTYRREMNNFDAIIADLKKHLKEAWLLPESQRVKVVKRLKVNWHPDRDPNNVQLYTRVFQTLQKLIGMLERGMSIDDVDENEAAVSLGRADEREMFDDDPVRRRAQASWAQKNAWRGKRRSRRRRPQHRLYYDENDHVQNECEEFFASFTSDANPQPSEARRWMKQAKYDLEAASNGYVIAYEWTSYMCYQVRPFTLPYALSVYAVLTAEFNPSDCRWGS
jgi:sacsin